MALGFSARWPGQAGVGFSSQELTDEREACL